VSLVSSLSSSAFMSNSVQDIQWLKELGMDPALEGHFILSVSMTTLLAVSSGLGIEVRFETVTNCTL
jgi:hypothetical protein